MKNDAPPAIEITNLVRRYGHNDAVNGLSLRVAPGRCYGFFGRNGAGKTTTIKCLLNLLRGHSFEEIVPGIVFADMLEAQQAPTARSVEIRRRQRGAELARLATAGHGAAGFRALHPSVPFGLPCRHLCPAPQTPLYSDDA